MVFKSKEICLLKLSRSILCTISGGIGSKTTNECGDDWRRLYTATYDWRRVHTSGCHAGEEYIRVPRGLDTSTYQNLKTGDEYIPVGRAYHEGSGLKLQTSAYQWVSCRRRVQFTGLEVENTPSPQFN